MAFIDKIKKYFNDYSEEKRKVKEANIDFTSLVKINLISMGIGLLFSLPLIGLPINLLMIGYFGWGVKILVFIIFAIYFTVRKCVYYDIISLNDKLVDINKKILKMTITVNELIIYVVIIFLL